MNTCYMTTVNRTTKHHKYPIIIHRDQWYFYSCDTMRQLDQLARTLGFSYTLEMETKSPHFGVFRRYSLDRDFRDDHFNSLQQLPPDAKPIKALSNGSIVTCYFTNDGQTITVYRPNPNCKDIYDPLPIDQHIAWTRLYGTL